MNVDYQKLQAACEAVKAALARGQKVHITHPNGTDLAFGIKGRTVFASDGIIPPDDPKKKAPPAVWLPAGGVIVTPVPGTAKGKVFTERQFYQGKLVSMTAEVGIKPLLERYQAARIGKEMFAWVDVGTNPNVRIPAGSRMVAYMPAGAITIGIGGNAYFEGENNLNFGLDFFLSGYTMTVDGQVLVENGVLKI